MANTFSFILKYRFPFLVICIIYAVGIILVCYSDNLKNDTLEKKIGIIESFKIDITPTKSWTWYIINFKLEGDTTIYAQEWRVINYPFLYDFLLENKKIFERTTCYKGSKIEFYKDKNSQYYPYMIADNVDNKSNKGQYILEKSDNINIIRTYGLIIEHEKIFDYTKRGFVTRLLGDLMIVFFILCIPLTILYLLYINMLLHRLIDKLPFKI